MDAVKDMVWSYSRLSAFEQCKYQFYLKYILCDENEYQTEGNYYAEVGSFVHSILEKIFKGELSVEDAPDYYLNHFDENVFYTIRPEQMEKVYEDCANYFSSLDLDWLTRYEILGVEKRINIQIDGYPFTGIIDLLLKNKSNGKIVLMDHKSGKSPLSPKTGKLLKTQEAVFNEHKKQLYLYSKAVKEEYGDLPSLLCWNHFRDSTIVREPFNSIEYEEALKWMVDTVHAIENEQIYDGNREYFYCRFLCPYRHTCEYAKYTGDR